MGSQDEKITFNYSNDFLSWLSYNQIALIFTTYQVGKVYSLGVFNGQLHVSERTFNRSMGLAISEDRNTLWLSSKFQIWKFCNAISNGKFGEYDAVYIPQVTYTTGDINVHDIALVDDNQPIFVNTLFSCIATVSESHSFKPVWKPNFITELKAEDRCHLNGIAIKNKKLSAVSVLGISNDPQGWRPSKKNGGALIDVVSGESILTGLSMPHSPRWYKDRLYLLESGTGYFGFVDEKNQKFERIVLCPGFLRGLDFIGDYAVVATSIFRTTSTFNDLDLDLNLQNAKLKPICGLFVINLKTGKIDHSITFDGILNELYDVKVLMNCQTPLLIGTQKEEINKMISIEN